MTSEPAPVPSCVHVPSTVLCQRPFCAMPAMMALEFGTADTMVELPHSDAMPARLPVTFTQAVAASPYVNFDAEDGPL